MLEFKLIIQLIVLLLSLIHFANVRSNELEQIGINNPKDIKPVNAYELEKRPSFFIGSRYGRSDLPTTPESRLQPITAIRRADRFFLSSRYGKRAENLALPPAYDINDLSLLTNNYLPKFNSKTLLNDISDSSPLYTIPCFYIGLENYYRCDIIV